MVRERPPIEFYAEVRSHDEMVDAFRARKEQIGLSNEFVEDYLGMTRSAVSKIFGPTHEKGLSAARIDGFCVVLGVKLIMLADRDYEARIQGLWERRDEGAVRLPRIGKTVLERARPLVVRELGRIGGLKRAANLTPSEREEIARIGGLASARARRARLKAAVAR